MAELTMTLAEADLAVRDGSCTLLSTMLSTEGKLS
jgi:hypothetical protein